MIVLTRKFASMEELLPITHKSRITLEALLSLR